MVLSFLPVEVSRSEELLPDKNLAYLSEESRFKSKLLENKEVGGAEAAAALLIFSP
jgi:hypothetical protein